MLANGIISLIAEEFGIVKINDSNWIIFSSSIKKDNVGRKTLSQENLYF